MNSLAFTLGLLLGFAIGATAGSLIAWRFGEKFGAKVGRMEQNALWRRMLAGRHVMTVPEAVVAAQAAAEGGAIETP